MQVLAGDVLPERVLVEHGNVLRQRGLHIVIARVVLKAAGFHQLAEPSSLHSRVVADHHALELSPDHSNPSHTLDLVSVILQNMHP